MVKSLTPIIVSYVCDLEQVLSLPSGKSRLSFLIYTIFSWIGLPKYQTLELRKEENRLINKQTKIQEQMRYYENKMYNRNERLHLLNQDYAKHTLYLTSFNPHVIFMA